jgi:hypothetical protein
MPPLVKCFCRSHKCSGTYVSPSTKRTHERNDLQLKTAVSQTIHRGLVISHASETRPTGSLTPPYPIRGPILLPVSDFPDPPASSPCAVEQEMIDHGVLTQVDINIQVYRNSLPSLGPNLIPPIHFSRPSIITRSIMRLLQQAHNPSTRISHTTSLNEI